MSEHEPEREGFFPTRYCPRGRQDCVSMSQIISDGHASFICCGENETRVVAQDKYRFCFKNDGVDSFTDNDKRDLTHMVAVIMQALAMIENEDCVAYHEDLA